LAVEVLNYKQQRAERNMLKYITHRPLWFNIIVGIILAVLLFFLLMLSLRWITNHGEAKTVPSVIGKTFDEALTILNDKGFEVVVQDSIYQDSLPRLMVLKQVPEGDAVVKVNRTVYLTINRSIPPIIEMPNVIGYSFRNAAMQLKNMGLRIGDTTFKPDFAKNSVLEQWYNGQKIEPGMKIQMGSVISLVLGSGVGQTEFVVPQIVGMTFGDAKALLESNGIGIGSIVAPMVQDTINAFIVAQNPERYNVDGKRLKIRPGQLMDVQLSMTRPIIDSTKLNKDPGF
jgi:beta-lactam-binding protein with PASTA domain